MSGTFSDQLTDALNAIRDDMAAISQRIQILEASLQPGAIITPDQITEVRAIRAAADALAATPAPTPPAEPPAPPSPPPEPPAAA